MKELKSDSLKAVENIRTWVVQSLSVSRISFSDSSFFTVGYGGRISLNLFFFY